MHVLDPGREVMLLDKCAQLSGFQGGSSEVASVSAL